MTSFNGLIRAVAFVQHPLVLTWSRYNRLDREEKQIRFVLGRDRIVSEMCSNCFTRFLHVVTPVDDMSYMFLYVSTCLRVVMVLHAFARFPCFA